MSSIADPVVDDGDGSGVNGFEMHAFNSLQKLHAQACRQARERSGSGALDVLSKALDTHHSAKVGMEVPGLVLGGMAEPVRKRSPPLAASTCSKVDSRLEKEISREVDEVMARALELQGRGATDYVDAQGRDLVDLVMEERHSGPASASHVALQKIIKRREAEESKVRKGQSKAGPTGVRFALAADQDVRSSGDSAGSCSTASRGSSTHPVEPVSPNGSHAPFAGRAQTAQGGTSEHHGADLATLLSRCSDREQSPTKRCSATGGTASQQPQIQPRPTQPRTQPTTGRDSSSGTHLSIGGDPVPTNRVLRGSKSAAADTMSFDPTWFPLQAAGRVVACPAGASFLLGLADVAHSSGSSMKESVFQQQSSPNTTGRVSLSGNSLVVQPSSGQQLVMSPGKSSSSGLVPRPSARIETTSRSSVTFAVSGEEDGEVDSSPRPAPVRRPMTLGMVGSKSAGSAAKTDAARLACDARVSSSGNALVPTISQTRRSLEGGDAIRSRSRVASAHSSDESDEESSSSDDQENNASSQPQARLPMRLGLIGSKSLGSTAKTEAARQARDSSGGGSAQSGPIPTTRPSLSGLAPTMSVGGLAQELTARPSSSGVALVPTISHTRRSFEGGAAILSRSRATSAQSSDDDDGESSSGDDEEAGSSSPQPPARLPMRLGLIGSKSLGSTAKTQAARQARESSTGGSTQSGPLPVTSRPSLSGLAPTMSTGGSTQNPMARLSVNGTHQVSASRSSSSGAALVPTISYARRSQSGSGLRSRVVSENSDDGDENDEEEEEEEEEEVPARPPIALGLIGSKSAGSRAKTEAARLARDSCLTGSTPQGVPISTPFGSQARASAGYPAQPLQPQLLLTETRQRTASWTGQSQPVPPSGGLQVASQSRGDTAPVVRRDAWLDRPTTPTKSALKPSQFLAEPSPFRREIVVGRLQTAQSVDAPPFRRESGGGVAAPSRASFDSAALKSPGAPSRVSVDSTAPTARIATSTIAPRTSDASSGAPLLGPQQYADMGGRAAAGLSGAQSMPQGGPAGAGSADVGRLFNMLDRPASRLSSCNSAAVCYPQDGATPPRS